MKKEELKRELNSKLKEMPWTYTLRNKEKTVEFANVRTKSRTEEGFLKNLKEKGAKQVIRGRGKISYKVARVDDKLWLSPIDNKGKPVGEPKEISEQTALEVFRESERETRTLGSLFAPIQRHKKVVPNHVVVDYGLIKNINLNEAEKTKLVKVVGEGFRIELIDDGGCALKIHHKKLEIRRVE